MPNFYCKCTPTVPRSLDEQIQHVFEAHRTEKPETVRVVLPMPKARSIGTTLVILPKSPLEMAQDMTAVECFECGGNCAHDYCITKVHAEANGYHIKEQK